MYKEKIKLFIPPIFLLIKNNYKAHRDRDLLFRGRSEMFRQLASEAKVYGEYGCGTSTVWVAENTDCTIYSVESSLEWSDFVRQKVGAENRLFINTVDLGELGDWGTPISYSRRDNVHSYIDSIWKQKEKPDFVLIDGRFRVACFLHTLLHAKEGTIVVVDDYTVRKEYHLVEEFLTPYEKCGTQAAFRIEKLQQEENIRAELERFLYVIR